MTENEEQELRDEVCRLLLSRMSKGTQFQFALDRMHQIYSHYTVEQLQAFLPKPKKKKSKGGGF
jgi:hypothetical protein